MSALTKRVKLAHDDAERDSEQDRYAWAQLALQNDFMLKPLPEPKLFVHISRMDIPNEVLFQMLHDWIGHQRLEVLEAQTLGTPHYTLSYNSPSNPNPLALIAHVSNFPQHLSTEYDRYRKLSWLQDTKEFNDPYTFYMSHYLMSQEMAGNVGSYLVPETSSWEAFRASNTGAVIHTSSPVMCHAQEWSTQFPRLTQIHVLEKIKLDFDAEQYFAFFDVAVPPFEWQDDIISGDNLYRDARCHGAGVFLEHTKELEIHFGDAYKSTNPWRNVTDAAWSEHNDEWEYQEARLRPLVCESGIVVDWILEYAWYSGYLQPVRKIVVTGDVQEWIREKWEGIFEKHREYKMEQEERGEETDDFAVHEPDLQAICSFGKVAKVRKEEVREPLPQLQFSKPYDQPDVQADADVDMDAGSDAGSEDGDQVDVDDDAPEGDDEDDNGYKPQAHYPPACNCAIGCWRLRGGKVEEKLPVDSSWDSVSDQVQGGWMDGFDVSTGTQW